MDQWEIEKLKQKTHKNSNSMQMRGAKLCFDLSGGYVSDAVMENTAERIAAIRTGEEAQQTALESVFGDVRKKIS